VEHLKITAYIMAFARQFAALPTIDHLLIGIVLLFDHVVAPRLGMWAYSVFALPGTLAHEFCHWLVALILGARPTFPNLIPKREGHAWRLGSVRASTNFLTVIPIALAPFALFPLGIWYAIHIMSPTVGWWYLLHVWIASTLLDSSLPSKQDWSVALPAIYIILIIYIIYRVYR
jgi:hypothetical protein